MTDRSTLILVVSATTALTAAQIAAVAGCLARRDHATWPQALTRAATAFAATISLTAVVATAIHSLAR